MKKSSNNSFIPAIIFLFSLPKIIFGYIGPGTGLTAIGTLVACVVGIIVTVIGFLWYPIKRILGRGAQPDDQLTEQAEAPHSDEE